MFKRSYVVTACGALALLLTAAQTCPAQFVVFPVGRGGTFGGFGPRSFGFSPSFGSPYYGSPYYGSPYSSPYYGGYNPSMYRPGYSSYSVNTVTPLYYGAASFSPAYSTAYAPRLVSPPLDTVARATDQTAPAAYATPTYPLRSPDYNVIYPVSPPLSMLADNTAKVEVHAPAEAKIWFDGQATTQTGTERSFRSPALEPRQGYEYEVRARWDADGKPVDQTRKVTVHAGDHVVLDFHRPEAAK
jgi:uncharacterized protein (TIGR03000 family)